MWKNHSSCFRKQKRLKMTVDNDLEMDLNMLSCRSYTENDRSNPYLKSGNVQDFLSILLELHKKNRKGITKEYLKQFQEL